MKKSRKLIPKKIVVIITILLLLAGITIFTFLFEDGKLTITKETTNEKALEEQWEQEAKLNNYVLHNDEETGVKYVTYEDFDVQGDIIGGIEDDYPRIKKAHEVANKYGYEVRATASEYHIFKRDDISSVIIQTNTNWNGATFIIHDEDIKELDTRTYSIFQIQSTEKNTSIYDRNILDEIKINKNTTKISELSGYGNCLCIVYNNTKNQFIRSGNNQNSGNSQRDLFKIDNEGNVLDDIQWDFDYVSSITLIPIPEQQLIVQNGNFITNLPKEEYEQETSYFNRNILCKRSNTVLRNINHEANNSEYIGGPYLGFIKISTATDVRLEDSRLYSFKYKAKSSYGLFMENAVDITISNVTSNDINQTNRWGITGTNYTKDVTYKNCVLNRIDAHSGVYNLNIENCEIGSKGITVVGSGNLNITNTISHYKDGLVYLRDDYGSTWDGTINISNCELTNLQTPKIIGFKIIYDNDGKLHDYGYPLYLPNININGLKINDSNINSEVSDIYIFYNSKEQTGVENGDITHNYTLPQNIVVKNFETTAKRGVQLFYNKFYETGPEISTEEDVDITASFLDEKLKNAILELAQNVTGDKNKTVIYKSDADKISKNSDGVLDLSNKEITNLSRNRNI